MRRPRVALISYEVHDEGGAERAVAEIVRRLHDRYEFVVYAAAVEPDLVPLVRWRRIPGPRRPFIARFVTFAVLAGLALRRDRVDLRHATGPLVPNKVDVMTVHFHHRQYVEAMGRAVPPGVRGARRASRALTRATGLALEWWCSRPGRVRTIAAVSEGQARWLRRRYPEIRVDVTPNGADVEPPGPGTSSVREDLGIPADAVVALFIGSDFMRKGLTETIDAIRRIDPARPTPIHLLVVGDAANTPAYAAYARESGVADRVHLVGQQSDVAPYFQASDIFVVPTRYETFCIAAYEAALFELPIVGTAVNGVEELVGDDEGGIVVRADAGDVAAALERLAGDPDTRTRMGRTAAGIAKRFTWEANVSSVAALYDSLLDRPRPRAPRDG